MSAESKKTISKKQIEAFSRLNPGSLADRIKGSLVGIFSTTQATDTESAEVLIDSLEEPKRQAAIMVIDFLASVYGLEQQRPNLSFEEFTIEPSKYRLMYAEGNQSPVHIEILRGMQLDILYALFVFQNKHVSVQEILKFLHEDETKKAQVVTNIARLKSIFRSQYIPLEIEFEKRKGYKLKSSLPSKE